MNNLNATIALISLKKYKENLKTRKTNYSQLEDVLPHDSNSSYYFATKLIDGADKFNKDNHLLRHYPLLHKTKYFNNKTRLPNTELLHSRIINLPLYETFNYILP